MTKQEQWVYNLERQLIRKHFKGLRPRPVKLVKDPHFGGMADEPNLLIDKALVGKKPTKDLEDLLKHELIHYELKDSGKDYAGHGQAFLKRAGALEIIGSYELARCFSLEEYEHTPTKRKLVRTPLKEVKERINQAINGLEKLIMALLDKEKVKFYPQFQSLRTEWIFYSRAVEEGKKFISGEHWEKRKGPKGKSLEDLRKEYAALKPGYEKLLKKFLSKNRPDPKLHRKVIALERKMDRLSDKAERDYNSQLS